MRKEGYYWIKYSDSDGEHGPTIAYFDTKFNDWSVCGSDVPLEDAQVIVISEELIRKENLQ